MDKTMKENIIRFAFVTVFLTALQMSLFPQEKLKIAVIPKAALPYFGSQDIQVQN